MWSSSSEKKIDGPEDKGGCQIQIKHGPWLLFRCANLCSSIGDFAIPLFSRLSYSPTCISRPQVRGAWIHAIRRDRSKDFKVTSNTRVCSAHFRESDCRHGVSAYAGTAAAPIELWKRNLVPNAVPSLFEWNSSLHSGSKPKAPAERDPLPSSNRRRRSLSTRGWRTLERTRRTVERTGCSELDCFRRNQPYGHISSESKSTLQRRNCECRSRLLASAGVLELIRKLAKENTSLREELASAIRRTITTESVKQNDKKFSVCPGLPNYDAFEVLCDPLGPKAKAPEPRWWRGKPG